MNCSRTWLAGSLVTLLALTTQALGRSNTEGSKELTPSSSGDDTAQLQAALAKCSNVRKPCELRLGAGVFHTDVLLVSGFNGSITGKGQGRTVIRALTSRPLRSTQTPFFAEPTLDEPYPVLLHFAKGGKIAISKLTLEFPSGMSVMPYDYYLNDDPERLGITSALIAAILVEGEQDAELLMSKVSILAADKNNFWGSNVSMGVRFQGELRFSGSLDTPADLTRKLQRGRFIAHDNRVIRAGNGFWIEDTNRTEGLAVGNDIDARIYGIITTNLGASRFQIVRNTIAAELDCVLIAQTLERPPAQASSYVVAQNRMSVNETGLSIVGVANDGVAMFDFAVEAGMTETMSANLDVFGNDITLGVDTFQGITVFSDGPGDVRVFGNRIRGAPTDAGIWVEFSRGTFVAANDLRAIDPPLGDVTLRETTRDCIVIEPGDTVQDEGANNRVIGITSAASMPSLSTAAATSLLSRARAYPGFRRPLPN
jgi:hypothetical protein